MLFGLAFFIDGALRIASAYVVRFSGWRLAMAGGLAEIGVAWIVMGNWPIHHHYTVPMCLGVVLIASGLSLARLGVPLAQLAPGVSITSLPMFATRRWNHARRSSGPPANAGYTAGTPMMRHGSSAERARDFGNTGHARRAAQ